LDKYHFYLEFDGKRTVSKAYEVPIDDIMAMNVKQAIDRFCKRKHLECLQFEELTGKTYRAYLVKKAFLKAPVEQVYFIKSSH